MLNLAGRVGEGFSLAIGGKQIGTILVVDSRRNWVALDFMLDAEFTVPTFQPGSAYWRCQNDWFQIQRHGQRYAAIGVAFVGSKQTELCFDIPHELRVTRTRTDGSLVALKPHHAAEKQAIDEGHRR